MTVFCDLGSVNHPKAQSQFYKLRKKILSKLNYISLVWREAKDLAFKSRSFQCVTDRKLSNHKSKNDLVIK